MRYHQKLLFSAALAPLALSLPNPKSAARNVAFIYKGNKGIKVPSEMRASTMQARVDSEGAAAPEVFNPGAWYADGAPATTHIKPAPAGGCATLYKVYTDMGGESWTNQTGWSTGSSDKPSSSSMGCCGWFGVTCKGDTIVGLDLADNRLNGALSPALFQIPGLDKL